MTDYGRPRSPGFNGSSCNVNPCDARSNNWTRISGPTGYPSRRTMPSSSSLLQFPPTRLTGILLKRPARLASPPAPSISATVSLGKSHLCCLLSSQASLKSSRTTSGRRSSSCGSSAAHPSCCSDSPSAGSSPTRSSPSPSTLDRPIWVAPTRLSVTHGVGATGTTNRYHQVGFTIPICSLTGHRSPTGRTRTLVSLRPALPATMRYLPAPAVVTRPNSPPLRAGNR